MTLGRLLPGLTPAGPTCTDCAGLEKDFQATANLGGSPRALLLHELGHRHLGHQHRAVALRAAVLTDVTSVVVAGSASASMLSGGTGLFLTICLPLVLLGQLRVRKTHREYEHTRPGPSPQHARRAVNLTDGRPWWR